MMATDITAVTAEADRLQRNSQWREAYEYLKPYTEEARDPELLWRLIRSYYRVGKHLARNKKESEDAAKIGMELSERGLAIDDKNFELLKWSGIFLNWCSELGGIKSRIESSFTIRDYFKRAIAIKGSDADTKHLMGRWCYEVASVSWWTRKAAAAIFATPPVSSYQEALEYFEDAEKTTPDFYTGNWLYLAKTYYQLSNNVEAKKWLRKLLEYEPKNAEDTEYIEEGKKLESKL